MYRKLISVCVLVISVFILTSPLSAQPKDDYAYFRITLNAKQSPKMELEGICLKADHTYKVKIPEDGYFIQINITYGNGDKVEQKEVDVCLYKGKVKNFRITIDAEPSIWECRLESNYNVWMTTNYMSLLAL